MTGKQRTEIHTDRLCLRSIFDADLEDMLALLTNKEIAKTFMLPHFESREKSIAVFERLRDLSASSEHFVYGIALNGQIIGFLNDVEMTEKHVEVGYVIHPACSSRGYATEALIAVMEEIFAAGYPAVTAGAFAHNAASMRVMVKSGMQKIAFEEDISYADQTYHCLYFSKTNPASK